jgi:CHASE3 domain sensor protein
MNDMQNETSNTEENEADSRADAIAILCLVLIAAGAMIYLANT